jgi:PhzF family phenazine biosynthesis protein
MLREFRIVDVFAEEPFRGNPLAVVHGADGLSDEEMLRFTRWMNLSETTFLLPPTTADADYRVRIFSPPGELPFAGHPTLGTCHAWLEAGGVPREAGTVVQECGAGLVPIRRRDGRLAFSAPPLRRSGPADAGLRARMAKVLGIEPSAIFEAEWVDNGPGWVVARLSGAEAVLAVRPTLDDDPELQTVGVTGPHPPGAPWDFEVRAFFRNGGQTVEDPVTGSLNASIGQWLFGSGRVSGSYTVRQGTTLGRNGQVRLEQASDGSVWVAGKSVTFVKGQVEV